MLSLKRYILADQFWFVLKMEKKLQVLLAFVFKWICSVQLSYINIIIIIVFWENYYDYNYYCYWS